MSDSHDRATEVRDRAAATGAGEPDRKGAVAAGGSPDDRRRKRPVWLWLAPLLAVIAAALILASLLGDDDGRGDPQGADPGGTATQQEGQSGALDESGAEAGQSGAGATGGGEAPNDGTLTARGESLLPPPAGGLGDYVGEQATGEGVRVLSVVQSAEDPNRLEGFFVGATEDERTYVEWGGDVGAAEADFQPEVGQAVNLEGPVRPAPEDPAQTLKLEDVDAQTVTEQGGYINAERVAAAG